MWKRRCLSFDEIGHRIRLILHDVVDGAGGDPSPAARNTAGTQTFGHLCNQLCTMVSDSFGLQIQILCGPGTSPRSLMVKSKAAFMSGGISALGVS